MTPESWYSWLKCILIGHDSRLRGHVPDINAQIQRYIESEKKAFDYGREHDPDNIICDQVWCEQKSLTYRAALTRQQQAYIEAIADYPGEDLC